MDVFTFFWIVQIVPNFAHLIFVLTVLIYLLLIFFPLFFCKITKRKHVGNIPWKSISFPNFVIINFINQYLFKCICERCLTQTEWELRKLRVCCLLNFKSKSVTLNVISQKKFYANNAIDNFVVFAVFTIRKRLIYL